MLKQFSYVKKHSKIRLLVWINAGQLQMNFNESSPRDIRSPKIASATESVERLEYLD